VRIGTATAVGEGEKSYRVFFEELPPADGELAAAARSQVRILTKMGIPIFVQPVKSYVSGAIEGLALEAGHVRFAVRNLGNEHFVLRAVRVKGVGASGDELFDRSLDGWYVLPRGTRVFDLAIPHELCAKLTGVTVESETERDTFKARVETPPEGCGAPDAPPPDSN
jgi:fimbrial chaperone protein